MEESKKLEENFLYKEEKPKIQKKAKEVLDTSGVKIDLTPAVKKEPESKKFKFNQWAVRRGIKPRHCAGMKAFVKNLEKARTLEAWDSLFKDY